MWRNLGGLLETTDRRPEALEAFRKALDLTGRKLRNDPADPTLQADYALYASKAGECAEAAAMVRSLRDEGAPSVRIAHVVASVLALCGEREEALEATREAIDQGVSLDRILQEDEFRSLHPLLDPPAPAQPSS
jgi:predicted Zn-dependent protease